MVALSHSKWSALYLFLYHISLYTFWFSMERIYKYNFCKEKNYDVFEPSWYSDILKGLEAAVLDFFIPRCDRYRYDFLHIKRFKESCCLKNIYIYLNLVANYLIFITGNVLVALAIIFYDCNTYSKSNMNLSNWFFPSFICVTLGFICNLFYINFRDKNSKIDGPSHILRDIGKLHEYFILKTIDGFKEEIDKLNSQIEDTDTKIIYIVKNKNDFYQIRFIGTRRQFEKAKNAVTNRP